MASNAATFRKLACSLPDAVESAHMGHPDFRVLCADGKLRIFATLSGESTGRGVLKLTLEQQASFCEEMPQVFEGVQGGWGRMGMTYVRLEAVDEDALLGALTTAHRNVVSAAGAAKSKRVPAERADKSSAARTGSGKTGPMKAGPKIKP
jgi:hypothetical protein